MTSNYLERIVLFNPLENYPLEKKSINLQDQ